MPTESSRPRLLPPANFAGLNLPVTRQSARVWFRVHWASRSAEEFSLSPGHRFSHKACRFPLLYLGPNIHTCLWEVFGNDLFEHARTIAGSRWRNSHFSEVSVPELKLCAVSTEKTRSRMSVDKSNLLAADLSIPQTWGLAIQGHPAGFDAIHYTSRFVDQPCLALFGRPGLQGKLRVTRIGALDELDEAVDWLNKQRATLV